MKKLVLSGKSQGKFALVDDKDFESVKDFKWQTNRQGYVVRCIWANGKPCIVALHRAIIGCPKGMEVDHINGNVLDNRRTNLRLASRSQNSMNKAKTKKPKSSIYKGVKWDKQMKKWRANICINYKLIFIGLFNNEKQAALAYDKKAKELHGEFANLNFPSLWP